jgi:hypothetical protein
MASLSDNVGLLFRMKADSSDVTKETAKVKAELTGLQAEGAASGAAAAEGLSAIAGPAAIAVAAVAAITVGVVALTKELFNLAEGASEYGSKIHDASQQTGASVETIQALKYAAETGGSSFEKISGSVAKFTTLLGQAADGNERAQATLEKYGITTTDVNEALVQAIAHIASLTNEEQKHSATAALFKDKTGEVLGVIKEMNGDLPAVIKKLEDLGILMSGKDADAADAFGDQLDTLKMQLSAVARMVGTAVIPIFSQLFTSLSTWLSQNQAQLRSWAAGIAYAMQFVVNRVREAIAIFNVLGNIASGNFIGATTGILNLHATPGAKAQQGGGEATDGGGGISLPGGGGGLGGRGGGGGGGVKVDPLDAQREANSRALAAYKALLSAEAAELKQSLDLRLIDEVKYAKAVAEIKLKELVFEQSQNDKLLADERLTGDKRVEAEGRKLVLTREIAAERINIANDVYEAIKKLTEKELKDFEKAEEEKEKIRQKARDKRTKAENVALQERVKQINDQHDIKKNSQIMDAGGNGFDRLIAQLQSLDQFKDNNLLIAGISAIKTAFEGLAQAVGQAVQAFVLYGNAGTSVRKVAAQIIASVASMAAVKAVFELAEGFAALARAFFGDPTASAEAVWHFKSAATYGIIAGVAAVAGRGVAGNSFNQASGGGSASGSGGEAAGDNTPLNFSGGGFSGFQRQQQRQNEVLGGVIEALDQFRETYKPTSPHALVAHGIAGNEGLVAGAVNEYHTENPRAATAFKRASGNYD